jgi:hypothetical protein
VTHLPPAVPAAKSEVSGFAFWMSDLAVAVTWLWQ